MLPSTVGPVEAHADKSDQRAAGTAVVEGEHEGTEAEDESDHWADALPEGQWPFPFGKTSPNPPQSGHVLIGISRGDESSTWKSAAFSIGTEPDPRQRLQRTGSEGVESRVAFIPSSTSFRRRA